MGDNRVCRMSYDMRFASDHVDVGVDVFLVKSISYHQITSSGGIVSFPVNNIINMRQLNKSRDINTNITIPVTSLLHTREGET